MKLEVCDIRKSFRGTEVLHGVSFEVISGQAMGFLGRNGAGKSTTIRCLMDVFHQDSGTFLMDGEPLNLAKYKVGYLPEERGMYAKNTLLSQLVYFAMLRGANKQEATRSAKHWVAYFGLTDYEQKPLETLSKGNQQKIQIAQSFLNEPDILILDEPFSGLDPVNAQIFKDAIADFVKQGKLVIFSSHQMAYVEQICDDITLIHKGEILLTGNLKDIKRKIGENKLYLSLEGVSLEQSKMILEEKFPSIEVLQQKNKHIIDTKNAVGQKEILEFALAQNWAIASFGIYEPSLDEIFVERAGD